MQDRLHSSEVSDMQALSSATALYAASSGWRRPYCIAMTAGVVSEDRGGKHTMPGLASSQTLTAQSALHDTKVRLCSLFHRTVYTGMWWPLQAPPKDVSTT